MATFKTRARTLDMLGRQQIAGIPTAISELFKNAHDAYANHVEIDYYRSDGLFVLRDDGMGMTREDFVSRWLTIATESKFDPAQMPPRDRQMGVRPMLGEKGIGRLAIATIGAQVLVLTRAKTSEGMSDLTAAFINWGIFEWPGVDLDEIDVPVCSFPGGTLPSATDVSEMVERFRATCAALAPEGEEERRGRLDDELSSFAVDPIEVDAYDQDLSLRTGSGTHFIIKPSSDLLPEDIDGDLRTDKATEKATPLRKALLGFSNTMAPGASSVIGTAFRDHKTDEDAEDLIATEDFFRSEEFENADHRIRGRFDEHGQFRGLVSIYGETVDGHIIPWGGARGQRTDCGPFSIDFAAFEGESRHSTMPYEEHAILAAKTEKLGGLYIYREGIRVLPYGDTDYDWLDIEFRRTKGAAYYYFSHRKMFGFVEIDAERNRGLREKAGREGFQENKAYREFKSILKNFFLQAAADFFRSDGIHSDTFGDRKEELSKEDAARRRRERQVSERKRKFEERLHEFFHELGKNEPQDQALALGEGVAERLTAACSKSDKKLAASEVLALEREAYAEIRSLESRYRIPRPRIGLSKATLRDWSVYNSEFASLQQNVFRPTRELIADIVGVEAEKARLTIDRRVRTEAALEDLGREARKTTGDSSRAVRAKADDVAIEVGRVARGCLQAIESELRTVLSEFQRADFSDLPDEMFIETREEMEQRIIKATEEQSTLLESILDQLQAVDTTGENSAADQLMAIEQRNVLLEEELEADIHLAQLGMAIEIINHEFSSTIRAVRNNLRRLRAWADANASLRELYDSIRASFDHLDGYLTLFTPLQRRLYRKEVEIVGSEIYEFLEELFRARFLRHSITFSRTRQFAEGKFVGYPSSFYPVFVNLVDNAVFWLSQRNPRHERWIRLHAEDGALLVQDSGPGISVRDRDAIFESGFTRRKPAGRGLGLYIGRESLRRVGYELSLADGRQRGHVRAQASRWKRIRHPMTTDSFSEHCRGLAKRFLQTAILVDDEAFMAVDHTTSIGAVVAPRRRVSRSVGDEAVAARSGGHSLDAKAVIDSFATLGVICGVIGPAEAAMNAIRQADIVVLDWLLKADDPKYALKLLTNILTGETDRNALRLVAFYTGEAGLAAIQEAIVEELAQVGLDPQVPEEGTVIYGHGRIVLYAKPSVNLPAALQDRGVAEDELPDRLVDDFSRMTVGLLPSIALVSLTAVRECAHMVLDRFRAELDPAFLAHRACLPNPEDAERQMVNHVADELRSLMDYAVADQSPAGEDAITGWIHDRAGDPPQAFKFGGKTPDAGSSGRVGQGRAGQPRRAGEE